MFSARIRPEVGQILPFKATTTLAIAMVGESVQAGFPSPAEDFIEGTLDLNELLVQRPAATFMVRVSGLSMVKAGLEPGDILVVDKSEEVVHEDIVIAVVDGDLTVKRFSSVAGRISLVAENDDFDDIHFMDGSELVVWGVVRSCIKRFKT